VEPILVYGFPAGSSMGLVAAFEWWGKPYRLTRVDMLGEMRELSYAAINARHETPALITDRKHALTETMAIAAWIEARDDERRVSFDPKSAEADRMRQLLAFVNTGFTGAFSPLWAALEMNPPDPALQDALRKYGRESVIERHNKLEAMMGDGPFLVGDKPSLADGVLIGVARWLDFHEVADAARWPRLHAWRRRVDALPAVQFALALEKGKPAESAAGFQGHVELREVLSWF
jgi:glutathione S-transferase